MRGCLSTILAAIVAIVLFNNFDKIITIGNALVDKVYNMVMVEDESNDSIQTDSIR